MKALVAGLLVRSQEYIVRRYSAAFRFFRLNPDASTHSRKPRSSKVMIARAAVAFEHPIFVASVRVGTAILPLLEPSYRRAMAT
jgi:hypothetical protein